MKQGRSPAGRYTRRRFLGLAGGAVAAAALVACGRPGGQQPPPTPPPLDDPEPRAPGGRAPQPGPTRAARPVSRGTLRMTGLVTDDGVYDPHRTEAPAFYGWQSLVYSRLLTYRSQVEAIIDADLATDLPEQPDQLTYVFTLRPGITWPEDGPSRGRAVTADDVKFSIDRQKDGGVSFVRRPQWSAVDRVEVMGPGQLRVTMTEPRASMLAVFAAPNSYIVPTEIGDGSGFSATSQPGSGPFAWGTWERGTAARALRRPPRAGGPPAPYLDAIEITQPRDPAEIEARLRVKQLDAALLPRPIAEPLAERLPGIRTLTEGSSVFFGMRFFTPQVPYNDPRLRSAFAAAVDRQEMIDQFFAGSGDVNPWVSWPLRQWTLPHAEVTGLPGYRAGSTGREADIAEARALMAAVRASTTLPEQFPLFVIEDAEATLGMGALIRRQLRETLDVDVSVYPLPVSELVSRMLIGEAPWAAGPDIGPVDLDDWLYPFFHSQSPRNSFALRDSELDALIDAQRREFEPAQRRELGWAAQRRLLALNAGVNFVSERLIVLAWPYVRDLPLDAADGYQHRLAATWLDGTDPSYRGRAT